MKIQRWSVYLVDLNPPVETKPGKLRPCVVVQDDALNEKGHPSTVVLPITSRKPVQDFPLRIYIPRGEAGLEEDSMVLVDQFLAWDNRRFRQYLGDLSDIKKQELENACRDFFGWSD